MGGLKEGLLLLGDEGDLGSCFMWLSMSIVMLVVEGVLGSEEKI